MADLIFGLAFIAMVAAPAMVATLGGRKEYTPGPEPLPGRRIPTSYPRGQVIRPLSAQSFPRTDRQLPLSDATTLPMHHARGMANR